ncbi:MAG: hypothetical protein AB7O38_03620 [Pirellulaceae bacterium]
MERLHIKLQRVQTWLFGVPRLRAMVGANVLLGETLRIELPNLARETGRGWTLAPNNEEYPTADPDDPLGDHDDPASDARDGILARDGGHFEALFANGAMAFADAAKLLLRSNLPDLHFHVSIDGVPCSKSQVHLSTALPVLAPCEWTGRGVASVNVRQGTESHAVSLDVKQRHDAARRTEDGTAVDIASMLSERTKLNVLNREKQLQELNELVGDGYLALIHADGNGVGSGAGKTDGERAKFFHKNRVLLRRAVKEAIDDACDNDKAGKNESPAPLVPLMLGGDDLLLICRARVALSFVVKICAELETIQQDAADFRLTLGLGVVIAKHTVPIHRLHEVAEQLASSAKRRFRGLVDGDAKRSVVDWAVFRTTSIDAPVEVRRRDWLRGTGDDLRVLSQRPIDVLGRGLDSLQGLVTAAEMLRHGPRSQFRYLVEQLPRGRALSELAFQELSKEAIDALKKAGVKDKELWRRAGNVWLTALLDLVEITEIAHLGRYAEHSDIKREVAHV